MTMSTGLTAAGTTQGAAFPIVGQQSVFTLVAAGRGCRLPGAYDQTFAIYNEGDNTLLMYPAAGDRIGQHDPNEPISLDVGSSVIFTSTDSALTPTPRTWNAVVAEASSALGKVQSISVSISVAELLAIHATPKTIVPAPGDDRYIRLINSTIGFTFGSAGYTGGTACGLYYGSSAGLVASSTVSSFMQGTTTRETLSMTTVAGTFTPAQTENQALTFSASSDFAAGDSTVEVTVVFQVLRSP